MMAETRITEITQVIQLALAPVFMLSAIGVLISSFNTRLGRAVDRRRVLEERLSGLSADGAKDARAELAQIARRIRDVYLSIVFAVCSGIFICSLIAGAFLGAILSLDWSRMLAVMFVLAVIALIASLLCYLRETFLGVTTPRYVPK